MSTIQERIAALNLGQVGRSSPQATVGIPRPPPLPRSTSAYGQVAPALQQDGRPDVGNQPAGYLDGPIAPQRPEKKRMPPPPPPRPVRESQAYIVKPTPRPVSAANPRTLPPRPSLPPRDSLVIVRKASQESITSTTSTSPSVVSNTSTARTSLSARSTSFEGKSPSTSSARSVKAPAYDATLLPKLPPRRNDAEKRPSVSSDTGTSNGSIATIRSPSNSTSPHSRPVSFIAPSAAPKRNSIFQSQRCEQPQSQTPAPQIKGSSRPIPSVSIVSHEAPATVNRRSALSWGLNKSTETTPNVPPSKPSETSLDGSAPPPIPLHSRPNLAASHEAKSPSVSPTQPASNPLASRGNAHNIQYLQNKPQSACLKCRDFSGPDNHAARFPRHAIPSQDIAWLAHQLADPFPSLTDKARALFTWQHHNIAYNIKDFMSGNLQRSTPASTIATGMAVCEGYAALFSAMALHVGLEALVVTGHGAGFGYTAPKPGEPIPPPNPTGHAWNAVKIDDGEWKLIDVCWGAGHVNTEQYFKHFHPECFTMSNEDFGLKHFPRDQTHFFRSDGRIPTWQEYYVGPDGPGEKVTVFTGCVEDHGFNPNTFLPKKRQIVVSRHSGANPKARIQFQMEKYCPHWNPVKNGNGLPYQYCLNVGGKDGREKKNIMFKTNGQFWWVDIAIEDLGCAGQMVSIYSVRSVNGEDGRGLTFEKVRDAMGRSAMGFGGVAQWQLV